jgi:hypothetical protein
MEVCNATPAMAALAAMAIRPTIARITDSINLFDYVNNSLVIKPSKGECCHSLVKFAGNQTSLLALNINNA